MNTLKLDEPSQQQRIQRWTWGLAATALTFFVVFIWFCVANGGNA